MSKHRKTRSGGAAILEFTLVGIPIIFVLISTFEMGRGMWMYHTLAAGVKEGTRYAIVHGQNCGLTPNTCTVTMSQIASKIATSGTGLSGAGSAVTLTFTDAGGTATSCTLSNCPATRFPPATESAPGLKVTIKGSYAFSSVICMLWPGAGAGAYGPSGTVNLAASSSEAIQF
jgi:Flp pilus assembly protein TadG